MVVQNMVAFTFLKMQNTFFVNKTLFSSRILLCNVLSGLGPFRQRLTYAYNIHNTIPGRNELGHLKCKTVDYIGLYYVDYFYMRLHL